MTVIVPVESGPGKFGTPRARMHEANLDPAAVPTVVEMLAPIPAPPGGSEKGSGLLLPLPALLGVVAPRFATDGDFEPPPQPATARLSPARTLANNL